ncbi:MAG: GGDEF domain-containing protein [Eubacteriales bacterium]|nr:GGDEF domain-containing protein [Eubacteriales bacterium]
MNFFGILVLFFFWQNQRKSGSLSLDDHLFNGILIVTMVEQLMDAGQWALDGASFSGVYALQMLCYSLGYAIAPVITCLWVMYCDLRVNMDERGLKRRTPLYLVPIILNTLLLVANLFTPLVFRIDAAHIYHRDHFFMVYMVLMYVYGFISLLLVLRKASQRNASMERTEFRYMALFIIPPLIAGVLQWIYYGISLIWLSMVLSIILVYVNVLSRQILTDPLTGLNNRRKLDRYLGMQINSTENNQTLFLMILDADGIKKINHNLGHAAGDRALVAIANILKKLRMSRDCFLARLGGDEFLILGHDQNETNPEIITKRIEKQISEFNATTTEPFQLSLSIGWAYFHPQNRNTVDALLNAADQSMYQAKRAKQRHSPKLYRTMKFTHVKFDRP